MSETGTKIRKYIYRTGNGYRVDIRKSGKRATRVFDFRFHNDSLQALESAISWRDTLHIRLYGLPITSEQKYGLSRTGHDYVEVYGLKFRILSGIYLETKNDKPLYFTVTKHKKKIRFSINKLGVFLAHKKALELCASSEKNNPI